MECGGEHPRPALGAVPSFLKEHGRQLNAPRPVGDATSALQGRRGKIADGAHHTTTMSLSLVLRCDGMGVVRIDASCEVAVVRPARPIGA